MKSPNCNATALTVACIEFRGRPTAGAVSDLLSGATVRSPPRGANFRAYSGYRGRQEPPLYVRRSRIAAVASLGDMGGAAWRLACDADIGQDRAVWKHP